MGGTSDARRKLLGWQPFFYDHITTLKTKTKTNITLTLVFWFIFSISSRPKSPNFFCVADFLHEMALANAEYVQFDLTKVINETTCPRILHAIFSGFCPPGSLIIN